MPFTQNLDETLTCVSSALSYLALGYSVIPLRGSSDPAQPKSPAVSWKAYQQRRASESEIHSWVDRLGAVGIVTGRISGLAVLDFDHPSLYERFELAHPELCQTRQVETRRGCHLYFYLPSHLSTRSQKGDRVDWLWEGCYVVAPSSVINGHRYKLCRGGSPRTLSAQDLRQIEAFLGSVGHSPLQTDKPQNDIVSGDSAPLSDLDLIGLYHMLCKQKGSRNQALFETCLAARDMGSPEGEVSRLLAEVHADNQKTGAIESPIDRYREAVATIHSAFSRPPRKRNNSESPQLPNTVREALLGQKQTYLVRTIEALRLADISSGMWFTEGQARELLSGIVGQHSIRLSLVSGIFERLDSPSGLPIKRASGLNQTGISQCFEITLTKPKLNLRGRPTRYYRMPSNIELTAQLGVRLTRISDPLKYKDLSSAKTTRQALHRGFIARKPGKYPSLWLAKRLGVSVKTKCRYDKNSGIQVQPTYLETPLHWGNLNEIPGEDLELGGICLLDDQRKKYPARVSIASRLLKAGRKISLLRRTINHYSISREKVSARQPEPIIQRRSASDRIQNRLKQGQIADSPVLKTSHLQPKIRAQNRTQSLNQKPVKPRNHQRKFRDEALEKQTLSLREWVNRLSGAKLSLPMMRKLVHQHGVAAVRSAIRRIEKRRDVINPPGLLIVLLRGESRNS